MKSPNEFAEEFFSILENENGPSNVERYDGVSYPFKHDKESDTIKITPNFLKSIIRMSIVSYFELMVKYDRGDYS